MSKRTIANDEYDLSQTDWMFAHHVRFGVDKLDKDNKKLAVVSVWNEGGKIITENFISENIIGADGRWHEVHRDRFHGKEYPIRLLVPYNLSGNHFEIAVIELTDRNNAASVTIFNNFNGKYSQLKNILAGEPLKIELPANPTKIYKCGSEIGEEVAISCKDGRCGDAVIAIARLKADNKLANYKNLAELYGVNIATSATNIFNSVRQCHFDQKIAVRKKVAEVAAKKPVLPIAASSYDATLDVDDSSDEEIVERKLKGYDILSRRKKAEEALKGASRGAFAKLSPEQLAQVKKSFLLQSLGVEILYSNPVNEKYYEKKKEILSGSSIIDLDEQKKWLKRQLENSLRQFFYAKVEKDYPQLFRIYENDDDFLKGFIKKNPGILDEVVAEMLSGEEGSRSTV